MITHNLGVVRESADHVYVMYAGSRRGARPHRRAVRPSQPSLYARADRLRAETVRRRRPSAASTVRCPTIPRRRPAAASRRAVRWRSPPASVRRRIRRSSADHSAACWLSTRRRHERRRCSKSSASEGLPDPRRTVRRGQGRGEGGQRRQFQAGQGRSVRARGRERLGQIDDRADDPRPDGAERGRDPVRGTRSRGSGATGAARSGAVQMVFQNPGSSLNPRRSIGQSIAVPLEARKLEPRRKSNAASPRLLEHGAIARRFRATATRMNCRAARSSASRSRARSRSSRKLIVLDEPTSALDVSVQAKIIELLDRARPFARPHLHLHLARS